MSSATNQKLPVSSNTRTNLDLTWGRLKVRLTARLHDFAVDLHALRVVVLLEVLSLLFGWFWTVRCTSCATRPMLQPLNKINHTQMRFPPLVSEQLVPDNDVLVLPGSAQSPGPTVQRKLGRESCGNLRPPRHRRCPKHRWCCWQTRGNCRPS